MRLNLGAGKDYRPGWTNVDYYFEPADMKFDLSKFQYPIEKDSVDEIFASHILEHLPDTVAAIEEWWRILKPGGKLTIRVPHYSHVAAYTNPTHKRFFTLDSMDYFTDNGWEKYGKARFRIISKGLTTVIRKEDSFPVRLHAFIVNSIIRISPHWLERFMVLFGGISEVVWTLEAVK